MYKTKPIRDKKGKVIHEVSVPKGSAKCAGRGLLSMAAGCTECFTPCCSFVQENEPAHHLCCCATCNRGRVPCPDVALQPLQPGLPPAPQLMQSPASRTLSLHLQDFQSKELPNSRIQPDRRWFGNTRVVGQKQLEQFRTEMSTKVGQCLDSP